MKYFDWDEEKNRWLIKHRGVSFEMCQVAIDEGDILDIVDGKSSYTHQRKFIVEIDNYAYVIPYVEDEMKIFFKTVYPSRKNTKKYLTEKDKNNN